MSKIQSLLLPQQHAIYYLRDDETEEIIYGGGAGGGKSALGCLWLIEMCQKYPGTRWLMGRSKLKDLKDTTLNTFFELASELKVSGQFTFNGSSNIIRWKNGSEILLKDLFLYPKDPNFDSLGSLEITGAFIDECSQIVYKAWEIVKSRIRYKLNEYDLIPKMLGTCNPSKNWTYTNFYKPYKDKSLLPDKRFIPALAKDNPNLPVSYINSLMKLEINSRERLYYGNWEYDDDPARLLEFDAISDYFTTQKEFNEGWHVEAKGLKYMTIDVARKGKDKTIFRIWHGWVCIKRVELDKNTITELISRAKELQREYGVATSNIIADEDGVGGGVVDGLRCKGFVNNSRPIDVVEGGKKVRPNFDNLKSQCTVKMCEMINDRLCGEICNDSNVVDSVKSEMEQVKLKDIDKDGKVSVIPKQDIKELIGRSPDDWDSIMMRYWFELKPPTKARIVNTF